MRANASKQSGMQYRDLRVTKKTNKINKSIEQAFLLAANPTTQDCLIWTGPSQVKTAFYQSRFSWWKL